ncbi:heterokaryon incompatibility protein [Colletotrichum plurivorum]|uniref:Heterokaryon incompatibility protein n=1 Tax=Colletotrichum plurivorum TaxID=2175906 RepID=A0A8H6MXJ9_9PEZI|nr:heterokaryon incompatibility protein [Colletotrichum plurivorum]
MLAFRFACLDSSRADAVSQTLVFGKSQMHYRCLGNGLSESFPVCHVPFQETLKLQQVSAVVGGLSQDWKWESIVDAYSQSMLTKVSDKVIVLAGIAGLLQQHLQDDYVVGLWRRNLVIELLWSMKPGHARMPRPKPCIAPTWSWLSTNGRVSVLTAHDPALVKEVLIQIMDYNIDLVDPDSPTGNVYPGAILQLRGKLKQASWMVERCFNPDHQYRITFDGLHQDPEHGSSFRPELDEAGGLEITSLTIFLPPVAVFCHGEAASIIMGLILTPVSEEAEIYRRIGHFLINENMGRRLLQQRASPYGPSGKPGPVLESADSAKQNGKCRQALADIGGCVEHPGQAKHFVNREAVDESESSEVLPAHADGRVEDEALKEPPVASTEEWIEIEEKDIVLV